MHCCLKLNLKQFGLDFCSFLLKAPSVGFAFVCSENIQNQNKTANSKWKLLSLNSTEQFSSLVSCTGNLDYILTDVKYQTHRDVSSAYTMLEWSKSFLFLLFNVLAINFLILLSCFEQKHDFEERKVISAWKEVANFAFRNLKSAFPFSFPLCMLFLVVKLLKEIAVVKTMELTSCFRWCSTFVQFLDGISSCETSFS